MVRAIRCFKCHEDTAVLTYEENRIYKVCCPVTNCDAQYRGSCCAAQRAKHNLGDPRTNADRIRAMSDEELERLYALYEAQQDGRLVVLPCKQYETVYYVADSRVYIGWYLAKAGETTHLILQDRIEMGICWATDGFWFLTRAEAEAALESPNPPKMM